LNKDKISKKIWKELKKVPFGETRDYSWLAEKVGLPGKVRYVSSFLKKNPYLISIPCHRIIHKNGKIGRYILGSDFKKYLIEWEKSLF